jgi:hypothetical protein
MQCLILPICGILDKSFCLTESHQQSPSPSGLIHIYVLGYFQVFKPINISFTCEQGTLSTVANAKTEEMGTSQEVIENTNYLPHIYVHVNTHRQPQVHTEKQACKDRVSPKHRGTIVHTIAQEHKNEVRVMENSVSVKNRPDLVICN